MEDKISVIIPFYNNLTWLEEAIESALDQTYTNTEIIVVDDGSKEKMSFIEEKYKGKVIFFHKKNEGAASARNLGVKKSSGKYIAFLDSDDIWNHQKLEKQIEFIRKYNKKWIVTSYKTFGDCKEKIVLPYVGKKCLVDVLYNSCKIQTSTIMVEKNLLIEEDIFFPENMKKGQDIYVWYRIASMYDYGVLLEPLSLFRIRGNNSYMSAANHIKTRAILWEKMIDENDALKKPKRFFTILGYKICYYIYKNSNKLIEKDSKLLKSFYFIPWILFRIDNFFIKKGEI